MANLKVRYLTTRPGAAGITRYFWQPKTELQKLGWAVRRLSDDRMQAIAEAEQWNAELDAWRSGERTTSRIAQPVRVAAINSVSALIQMYKGSNEFKTCAESTRKSYARLLNIVDEWSGDLPAKGVTRKAAREFYRKLQQNSLSMANAIMRVARLLFEFGRNEGWLDENPFSKPGLIGINPRQTFWYREDLEAMLAAADRSGRSSIGTAILLAWYLGQREGDILHLTWSQYSDGRFRVRQRKTGTWIEVKAHPLIVERLSGLREKSNSTQIVVSETTNRPYTSDNFRHLFSELRDSTFSRIPKGSSLLFMDLRRTAVINLAEAGCTEAEIAAITGHSIETCRQILETYLPRTGAMAANAIDKLIAREIKMGVVMPLNLKKSNEAV